MRLLILLLALLAAPALAEEPRTKWYLLVGAGQASTSSSTSASASNAELAASGFAVTSSSETSDGVPRTLGAGYILSRHLHLEAAYTHFGDMHHYQASFNVPGGNVGARSKDHGGDGLQFAVLGVLPLGHDFALLGKLGAMVFRGEYRTQTSTFTPTGVPVSSTQESTSGSELIPGIGLGASVVLDGGLDLRVMLEAWNTKSGMFGAGNDLDSLRQISLTLTYRF